MDNHGNGKHTVFEHSLYVADFVKECNSEYKKLTDEQELIVCNFHTHGPMEYGTKFENDFTKTKR